MKRILIRCDIGNAYGMGHAVRCKALATALVSRGAEVRFLTRTPALSAFCGDVFAYETSLDDYGEHSLLAEAVSRWEADTLILDIKYPYDAVALCSLTAQCRVVRIDHPDATSETCDLLIAPVAHWSNETVTRLRQSFGERFLYGWDYVILDETVTNQQPLPYNIRAPHIVFCAGGSDPTGTLEQMYAWTDTLTIDAKMLFCFGAQSQSALRQRYEAAGGESLCTSGNRYIVPFHRDYLRQAALVVCMFGVTAYECLWYWTPAVCFGRTAGEQHDIVGLGNASCQSVSYGGPITGATSAQLHWYLTSMFEDGGALLRQKYEANTGFMDGQGMQRVVEAILRLA